MSLANHLKYTLYFLFLMSGGSALLFQILWFRLTGLTLGNSVGGAAVVWGAFMLGLAIGNWLIVKLEDKIKNPLQWYAALELIIGLTGYCIVIFMPHFLKTFSLLFRPLLDSVVLLNLIRFGLAFTIFLVPTTAMGATLPLVVRSLRTQMPKFGSALGNLYGWNTLGAMFGILIGEFLLIKTFGIRGVAALALSINLVISFIALKIKGRIGNLPSSNRISCKEPISSISLSGFFLLFTVFGTGLIMLALEVIWFRLMLVSYIGTTQVFAIMTAVVLAGISLGGFLAGKWISQSSALDQAIQQLLSASTIVIVCTYWLHAGIQAITITHLDPMLSLSISVALLVLPGAILSGILFTTIGSALDKQIKREIRTTGLLTCANTIGGAIGSVTGGILLLRYCGVERSIFILALGYFSLVLILFFSKSTDNNTSKRLTLIFALFATLILFFFPHGHFLRAHIDSKITGTGNVELVEVREGLTATNLLYRYSKYGEPDYYRLVTDAYSMTATSTAAQRYMRSFAYLAAFFHHNPRNALLISYGIGSTADALTNLESLEAIDCVDISKDAYELSEIVFMGDDSPLADIRVNQIIEDGRFYLNVNDRNYDIITSEPPPPTLAGIVNLYSEEYFYLLKSRLNPGGIVTYWLPTHSVSSVASLSIIRSFCNAFEDCSLWEGFGPDLILIGSADAIQPLNIDHITQFWKDEHSASGLNSIGLERPAQIGSMFLADAEILNEISKYSKPVSDNYPYRISEKDVDGDFNFLMDSLLDYKRAAQAFKNSSWISGIWPNELLQATLEYFSTQKVISYQLGDFLNEPNINWPAVDFLIRQKELVIAPLWGLKCDLKSHQISQKICQTESLTPECLYESICWDLVHQNYPKVMSAVEANSLSIKNLPLDVIQIYCYALAVTGNSNRCMDVLQSYRKTIEINSAGNNTNLENYQTWLFDTFKLKNHPGIDLN